MTEFVSKWKKNYEPLSTEPPKPTKQQNDAFVGFGGAMIGHPKKFFPHKKENEPPNSTLDENESKDQKAREAGFIPLISGEVYERQYSPTSHVFVTMDSNYWNAHRETWQQGKVESTSYKQIAERASFDMALLKAKQYVEYFTKKQGG